MAFAKSKNEKKKIEYIKLADVADGAAYIQNGEAWLKSGKYTAAGLSIPLDEKQTLSDWVRHVALEDVTLLVSMRTGSDGKEYPELTICGGDHTDAPF